MKRLLCLLIFCFCMPAVFAVNMNFKNAPVKEALAMLGEASNQNIVVDPNITGRITANLNHLSFDQALAILLKTDNLVKENQDGVISVATTADALAKLRANRRYQQKQAAVLPMQIETIPVQFHQAEFVKRLLVQLNIVSKRTKMSVDEKQNTLIVDASSFDLQKIKHFLKAFDKPAPQVLIKARIVQIDTSAMKALGLHFKQLSAGSGASISGKTNTVIQNAIGTLGLSVGALPGSFVLDMALQTLQSEGKGEVVSAPHLMVRSGDKALIEQGAEVPYATASGDGAYQVQFKKAVLGLSVTPKVLNQHMVLLNLKVSKDSVSKTQLASAKHEPIINTQDIQTQVRIKSGHTIVLGGILASSNHHNVQKIPLLGDIPGLGVLFRSHDSQSAKQEVLIFVTPVILSGS